MESFESNCEKAFKSVITECFKTGMLNFAKAVSEKHGVELDELLELWNETNEDTFKLSKTTTKAPKAKSKAKSKSKDGDEKICEAVVKKTGDKCTFKVSQQSSSGKYCGRHLKEEKDGDDAPKEKKPKAKSKTKAKTKKSKDADDDEENGGDDENEEESPKQEEKKQPVKVCIKRDSFGRLVDASSGLVFNTSKEVVGKAMDDGSVGKLGEDDLKVCKKYGVVVKQKVEEKNNDDEDDE